MERQNKGNKMKKRAWSAEEDEVLINYVNKFGPRKWHSIQSKGLLSRSGQSCRFRWLNHLQPNLKTGCKFSAEEERVVLELQAKYGNKWSKIATYLQGRTEYDVKNFWHARSRRMERQKNKHITISEPQTLNELLRLEVPSSSSSQLEEQSSIHMLAASEPCTSQFTQFPDYLQLPPNHIPSNLFEPGVSNTSLQFMSTSMPKQQEIEAESSLQVKYEDPYSATPDDFDDFPDNWFDFLHQSSPPPFN